MGCGKTTLGRELASLLRRPFVDTDEEIERSAGSTVPEIFSNRGEKHFRSLEYKQIRQVVSSGIPAVVALGGGTLLDPGNLELIKRSGVLVYIQLPVQVLAQRLANETGGRPLLRNLEGEALEHLISSLLEERLPAYEQATLMVNGMSLDAGQLLRILETL
jgi:shikimate kinase